MYLGKLVELAPADELNNNPKHPYTKSLLSAIPQPDPIAERTRKRIYYDSTMHNYNDCTPTMHEISPEHFLYGSDEEIERYKNDMEQ